MSNGETPLFEIEEPDDTLTVRELANRFTKLFRREFPKELWVRGQIRNLSRSAKGHVYFALVEPVEGGQQPEVSIPVVLWDSTRQKVNRALKRSGAGRIEDGMEIRIRAAIDYYLPQGSLQMRMTAIDPEYTLGRLAADRERLLRQLTAEGLLDANGGLDFPLVPQHIALVTSAGSAAAADFADQLDASWFHFRIEVFDARVQGVTAPESVARAIMLAADSGADVIAVVRGGGSRTDLATFDHEGVVRAIAGSSLPVVTGIGHEIDRSLADEVAHLALKTPTACAQVLIDAVGAADARFAEIGARVVELAHQRPAEHELILHMLAGRVVTATQTSLDQSGSHIGTLATRTRREANRQLTTAHLRLGGHAARVGPATSGALRTAQQRTGQNAARLTRTAPRIVADQQRRLTNVAARVKAYDPMENLRRGWSITTDRDGNVVRSVADIAKNDQLTTRVSDGLITSVVEATETDMTRTDQ